MSTLPQNPLLPHIPFLGLIDLASETVGGKALETNDDFFAPKENLLKAAAPVFLVDKYDENGKWMDGWESRRKRGPGHDWCVIQLGLPGVISGVNVDTSFFTGNYPEYCSIEACETEGDFKTSKWTEILPKTRLQGGSQNLLAIDSKDRFTHLRLNIFPDGGVARLRVHGEVRPDWKKLSASGTIDLASIMNGGTVVTCNDMFFGQKDNLILPGRATTMGGGWETRRRRGPGFDWIIIQLGVPGMIEKIEVDTNHYKGNFPDTCSIQAVSLPGKKLLPADFRDQPVAWEEILPQSKLQASHIHLFEKELLSKNKVFTHIKLNIYPDGGISRFRVHGKPAMNTAPGR